MKISCTNIKYNTSYAKNVLWGSFYPPLPFRIGLKLNFESIVIPSSVKDETDFVFISLTCNVCEPVFPRIIN